MKEKNLSIQIKKENSRIRCKRHCREGIWIIETSRSPPCFPSPFRPLPPPFSVPSPPLPPQTCELWLSCGPSPPLSPQAQGLEYGHRLTDGDASIPVPRLFRCGFTGQPKSCQPFTDREDKLSHLHRTSGRTSIPTLCENIARLLLVPSSRTIVFSHH